MDFENNSLNSKEQIQQKEITPVKANVSTPKQSKFDGVKILSNDAHNVGKRVIIDVIVPKVRDLFASAANFAVNYIFYGRGGSGAGTNVDKVSYQSYYGKPSTGGGYTNYAKPAQPQMQQPRNMSSKVLDVYNIIFKDYYDDGGNWVSGMKTANDVLLQLQQICATYQSVSVHDVYDILQQPGDDICSNYGWFDLSGVGIIRKGDGYAINFPNVTVITKTK